MGCTGPIMQPILPYEKLPLREVITIMPEGTYNKLNELKYIKCQSCNSYWSGSKCGKCGGKLK